MKWIDIKNLNEVEVQKALKDARSELVDLKFKIASGSLKQVREIRKSKKSIAHLLTRLSQITKEQKK
jgi:ribosomal protein L29